MHFISLGCSQKMVGLVIIPMKEVCVRDIYENLSLALHHVLYTMPGYIHPLPITLRHRPNPRNNYSYNSSQGTTM